MSLQCGNKRRGSPGCLLFVNLYQVSCTINRLVVSVWIYIYSYSYSIAEPDNLMYSLCLSWCVDFSTNGNSFMQEWERSSVALLVRQQNKLFLVLDMFAVALHLSKLDTRSQFGLSLFAVVAMKKRLCCGIKRKQCIGLLLNTGNVQPYKLI